MSDRQLPVVASSNASPYPYSAIPEQYAHPGISLAQLFAIVWAYRKFTLSVVMGCLVIAAAVTKLIPKSYDATATLMVDYEVNDPLGGREFPVSLMGSYMATQTQLIQSPAVLLPVIEKLRLRENEDYTAGFKGGNPAMLDEFIRDQLTKKLSVEKGDWSSQLINISYSANSPEQAALIANTVADVYAEQQFLRLTGPASERAERYTQQLDELKHNVNEAQNKVTEFRQRTGIVDSGMSVDIDFERLSSLEQRLIEAREQRRLVESRNVGEQATRDATLGSSSIQALKGELSTQQTRLAELGTTLGPRHPQVVELRSQISAIQRALDSEMQVYSGNADNQLSSARNVERQLQTAVDSERTKVLEKRTLQDEGARFDRELQTAQTLYQRALDGYDQIVLSSGGKYNNVRFVSRASPPAKASKPKPIVNMVLGLMAGCFFGVIGPLVYELLNRRVRHRDDLDRDFGIPVLAEFDRVPKLAGAL